MPLLLLRVALCGSAVASSPQDPECCRMLSNVVECCRVECRNVLSGRMSNLLSENEPQPIILPYHESLRIPHQYPPTHHFRRPAPRGVHLPTRPQHCPYRSTLCSLLPNHQGDAPSETSVRFKDGRMGGRRT